MQVELAQPVRSAEWAAPQHCGAEKRVSREPPAPPTRALMPGSVGKGGHVLAPFSHSTSWQPSKPTGLPPVSLCACLRISYNVHLTRESK